MFSNLANIVTKSVQHWENRPALYEAGCYYSYRKISARAQAIIEAIQVAELSENPRIGIFSDRGFIHLSAIIASILSGSIFIPLNKSSPHCRNREVMLAAGVNIVVVDYDSIQSLNQLMDNLNNPPIVIFPEEYDDDEITENLISISEERQEQNIHFKRDYPLYILFTSGSTGKPKGVPIGYDAFEHFLYQSKEHYRFTSDDKFLQTFDLSFDLALFPLLMAWLSGATIYYSDQRSNLHLVDFVNEHQITVWFSVPTMAAVLAKINNLEAESMPSLRYSLFCGEELHCELARCWRMAANNSVLENLYGPTELTLFCTRYVFDINSQDDMQKNKILSIGKPLPGLKVLIRHKTPENDSSRNTFGELCVAGKQLFDGYLHDPILTKEMVFEYEGELYYRTGDNVQVGKNGNLFFMGRTDQQVKVRGYRIHLQEVEGIIRSSKKVNQVAVIACNPISMNSYEYLVAFIAGDINDENSFIQRIDAELAHYR